tara:strand:+ start:791 stop:1249 length:459 start_codon:yes stop_codon:yes gene_type:complete
MKKWALIALVILGGKLAARSAWAGDLREVVRSVKVQFPVTKNVPEGLVVAIAKVESNHNQFVTGSSGEYGMMQIRPLTFGYIFRINKIPVPEYPYELFPNVLGGMLYLAKLYSVSGSWLDAIHMYNVGPGAFDSGSRNWDYFGKVIQWWVLA